jgi:hypothetical protein
LRDDPQPSGGNSPRAWIGAERDREHDGAVTDDEPSSGGRSRDLRDAVSDHDLSGAVIVRANVVGTTIFVASAVLAAVLFSAGVKTVAAVVALVLFFAGIAAFLWSFWNAVQRSRGEQVAVTQLYLLTSGVAPQRVRRTMMIALGVQCVAGLGTALARPNASDGRPGTSLALGVLVPIFGFGLNGLWAAYHGRYRERRPTTKTTDVRTTSAPIDQNERHG